MKKTVICIGILIAVIISWLPSTALATETLFQGCTVNHPGGFIMQGPVGTPGEPGYSYGTEQYQTFTATKIDNLTKMMVVVSYTAVSEITMLFFKQGQMPELYSKTFSLDSPNPDASPKLFYAMSDDNLNIPLEAGAIYSIGIYTGPYTLSWPFSEDPNCDPYGSTSFRTADGTPALPTINDFWYNVWGTKTAVAAPAATPDTTPAVTSDSASQPSGAAPAAPTASIKAPTELSVDDIPTDQGGAIKLDWKASTTSDIDGYKIFRSAEEKKGFAELAKTTDKAILTYIDSTAAIGQKYYYIVRAYKDDKESANSNTINATSIDNMPPAAPKNFTYSKSALGFAFAWDKNAETDLAGYSLQISDSSGKLLKTIEIEKDANLYELIVGDHAELKVETAYQFVLIAQDSSSNFSERTAGTEKSKKEVVAVSSNDSEGKSPLIWYLSSAVAILLIVGGGLYWFKFRKKKLDLTP